MEVYFDLYFLRIENKIILFSSRKQSKMIFKVALIWAKQNRSFKYQNRSLQC